MNNRLILLIAAILLICVFGHSASPVYSEFTVDTSLYEYSGFNIYFTPDLYLDGVRGSIALSANEMNDMYLLSYLQKNTDQIDLFSFNGKCGAVTIPNLRKQNINYAYCSRTFIDDDADWEALVNIQGFDSSGYNTDFFTLYDTDGTILLSDSGRAFFGFDGQNTYVVSHRNVFEFPIRSWRFRTNISAAAAALRKSTASPAQPMTIYGPTNDNLRIKLIPTGSNQTTVQLFDLLGRCLFSKQVGKLTSPVTFTVPEGNVPQSPFITRVENDDGVYLKKRLPVR